MNSKVLLLMNNEYKLNIFRFIVPKHLSYLLNINELGGATCEDSFKLLRI